MPLPLFFLAGFATIISMRYIGIDYGSKRIGIAVSDPEGRLAFPQKVIEGGAKELFSEIRKICREEPVEKIIVGLPLALDEKETKQTEETIKFADKIKKNIKLPVEFENEMLTTKIAKRPGVKKELVDASSAAIILQSYLDKHVS